MLRRLATLAVIASVSLPLPVSAQQVGPERQDLTDLRGDIWSVWSSPAHPNRSAIAPLLGVSAAVALVGRSDSAIYVWLTGQHAVFTPTLAPLREDWRFPLFELGS